jgi:hypothetical protein
MHVVIANVWCQGADYSTVQGRCIPIDNIGAKFVVHTIVSGVVKLLLTIIGNFTDAQKYHEVEVYLRYWNK